LAEQISGEDVGEVISSPIGESFSDGDVVNIQATTSDGYEFDGWEVTVGEDSQIANLSSPNTFVTMTENITVYATFKLEEFEDFDGDDDGDDDGTINITIPGTTDSIFQQWNNQTYSISNYENLREDHLDGNDITVGMNVDIDGVDGEYTIIDASMNGSVLLVELDNNPAVPDYNNWEPGIIYDVTITGFLV